MDGTLSKLNITRLQPLQCADEMKSQDDTFRSWLDEATSHLCAKLLNCTSVRSSLKNADDATTSFPIGRFVDCKDCTQGVDGMCAREFPVIFSNVSRQLLVPFIKRKFPSSELFKKCSLKTRPGKETFFRIHEETFDMRNSKTFTSVKTEL